MHTLNPGRFAAVLYLLASLAGFFRYIIVDRAVIVKGDPASTARRILESETLFRLGMFSELVSTIGFIFLVLALYGLFRKVDRRLAMVMVVLVLVSVPISMLNIVNEYAALRLLKGGVALSAFTPAQLQQMALLSLRMHSAGLLIAQIFWGLWLLPLGILIRRSNFMPRMLGTLLIPNGIAYPAVTLAWLLTPAYFSAAFQLALLPQMGELWVILWLLIKGVPAAAPAAAESVSLQSRPRIGAVTALLAMAMLGATAHTQPNAETLYDRGREALLHGRAEQAVVYFNEAIALRPADARLHYRLGYAYGQAAASAGLFEKMSLAKKAKASFERAVELDPDFIPARQALVDFHVMLPGFLGGDEAAAMVQAGEIRKRDPIEGHRAFARIHVSAKRLDLARREYAELLNTHGRSAHAQYLYGVFQMLTEKNLGAAAAAFETALKLDQSHMPASFQIGHTAALAGIQLARGEAMLKRYVAYRPAEDEPSIARAHYWLGAIYEKQRRNREAKASYEASLAINPNQDDVKAALRRLS